MPTPRRVAVVVGSLRKDSLNRKMAKADTEGTKRFAPYLRLYLAGNPLSDAARAVQVPVLKKYGVRVAS